MPDRIPVGASLDPARTPARHHALLRAPRPRGSVVAPVPRREAPGDRLRRAHAPRSPTPPRASVGSAYPPRSGRTHHRARRRCHGIRYPRGHPIGAPEPHTRGKPFARSNGPVAPDRVRRASRGAGTGDLLELPACVHLATPVAPRRTHQASRRCHRAQSTVRRHPLVGCRPQGDRSAADENHSGN